jgi:3-deoxy-D-manno-octulosonic-acid transferase
VLIDLAYDLAGQLASGLVSLAPDSNVKVIRAFHERRGVLDRFAQWAREKREASRPLIWFHAPSYGEGLQARPVIERLRAKRPDFQIAYTFFSPSAEGFARGLPVDVADYLPFDTRYNARRLIDAVRPSALIFSKLDVWPRLSEVCHAAHVPLGIVSATMSAAAGRRQPLARALLRRAYGSLSPVRTPSGSSSRGCVARSWRSPATRGMTRSGRGRRRLRRIARSSIPCATIARPW